MSEVFAARRGDLVYLSPDAEETLHALRPGALYVIGGIVDKTARAPAPRPGVPAHHARCPLV